MRLAMRLYGGEEDYWRIRAFLREVYLLNNRRYRSWDVVRFDYWRWHGALNITPMRLEHVVALWETPDHRIAAILNPEGHGEAFLQLHPRLASADLVDAMLDVAEERLAVVGIDGRRSLRVWANRHEERLWPALQRRGYARCEGAEFQRRRALTEPLPEPAAPPGYRIRPLQDGAELLERCYASGLAFHPDDLSYAANNRADVGWYRNIQNAPLYRQNLDLVAIAPDGAVAAFCTVWFDDVTRSGVFEPVGTVPAHQRRGLGRALLAEGLRRLRRLGATQASVGSYGPAAHALYEASDLTDYELCDPWLRAF